MWSGLPLLSPCYEQQRTNTRKLSGKFEHLFLLSNLYISHTSFYFYTSSISLYVSCISFTYFFTFHSVFLFFLLSLFIPFDASYKSVYISSYVSFQLLKYLLHFFPQIWQRQQFVIQVL